MNGEPESRRTDQIANFAAATIVYAAAISVVVLDMWGLRALLRTTGWPFMFFLFIVMPYSAMCMSLINTLWLDDEQQD